jgi:alpha-glucoside transport system substrate-binding protein
MTRRMGTWVAVIAMLATLASLVPGGPAARAAGPSPLEEALAGKYKGTKVSVGTTYGDEWYTDFDSSLKSFTDKTGIDVRQTMTDAGSDSFRSQVEAGNGPDVVEIGLPAQLLALARAGKVVDVTKFLDMDTLRARYDQNWLDWATMAGPTGPILAGVWTGSNMDSLVSYPKAAFDKAGYKVPTTWQELLALSDRIVKDGGTPWCIANGFQGGDSTGYATTHWISDILLRTASLQDHDRWVKGELKFSSPQVKNALQLMSDLWFKPGYAYGGRPKINTTQQSDVAHLMMDPATKCWLAKEPNWLTDYDGVGHPYVWNSKVYGRDYDFFVLPPIDPAYGTPVVVEGMLAMMFHDRPEVRALMEYFTTGEQVHDWITRGVHDRLSPHKAASLDWYTNPRERAVAELVRNAKALRYWGADMMPDAVLGQFVKSMAGYVDGKMDLDAALKQIDDAWPVEK